jgi:hypothetical protein
MVAQIQMVGTNLRNRLSAKRQAAALLAEYAITTPDKTKKI